jgi:tRNA(fMet)-specific endonuclease VapC
MILLDTDHVTILKYDDTPHSTTLAERLRTSSDGVGTTVITLEEQLRGWLAKINQAETVRDQIRWYEELTRAVSLFSHLFVAPLDGIAAGWFESLRKQKVRVGSMDLKIASIALARNALLLSANLRDFEKVPGLRVENWLS